MNPLKCILFSLYFVHIFCQFWKDLDILYKQKINNAEIKKKHGLTLEFLLLNYY